MRAQSTRNGVSSRLVPRTRSPLKDEVLDKLAESANVAQFVSYGPDLTQRFSRIIGYESNCRFPSVSGALEALMNRSSRQSINIRSFHAQIPKRSEFLYGIQLVSDAESHLRRLAQNGFHTIANETIDVNDGGVSGVSYGGVVEFAPGDTPKCVEKPGTAVLPSPMAATMLETVYSFRPTLDWDESLRVEFSIHPLKCGLRHAHTIIWEIEEFEAAEVPCTIRWPNHFSRLLGDKTFGLLVAHTLGFRIPATTVISRAVSAFSFGLRTGTGEFWIRTSPREPKPGFYPTEFGWRDPFSLISGHNITGDFVASILSQESVDMHYSGALVTTADGTPYLEGVTGRGDEFMQGRRAPESLPPQVVSAVLKAFENLKSRLGPIRFEWVFDSEKLWIIQLHCGGNTSTELVIYPGLPTSFKSFNVEDGIEALRELIPEVKRTGQGILLLGRIGITSHLGDLLRRAKIPSRIAIPSEPSAPENLRLQF